MESRRQLKVASLIKEALAEILTRTGKSIYGNAFVTVTNVRLTSDLLLARFNFSVYGSEDPDGVVEAIKKHKFEIKKALGESLRHHMRRVPEMEFYRDGTLDYVFHMEDVFSRIKEEDEKLKREKEAQAKVAEPEQEDAPIKKAPAKKAAAKKAAVKKAAAKAPAKKAAAKKSAPKKSEEE